MGIIRSDSEFLARLGRNVRAERKRLGLSQIQLAKRSGVGRTHIGFIEQGRQNATLRTLRRLSKVFGGTVSDLLPD